MKKYLLLCFMLANVAAYASHIVGGELYYQCLGNNQYRVTLELYRDCYCVNCAAFGDPEYLTVFYTNTNAIHSQPAMIFPGANPLNPPITNPCLVPPDVCVERAVYSTTITLPPVPGGYDIVYQRCCRNSGVANLPPDQGATYIVHIPGSNQATNTCNSSPRYNNFPPTFLCVNAPFVFDHSATDADGDQLVYSLCDPFEGADAMCPDPSPGTNPGSGCPTEPLPPPYAPVQYAPGYNSSNFLNSPSNAGNLTINPTTGLITGRPNTIGMFVVAVCVQEFRNGVLLSEMRRDFQFNVAQCNVPIASIPSSAAIPGSTISLYQQNCSNFTVTFQNNTYNPPPTNVPLQYHWDFGVPGLTNDTSNQQFPVYTYPDTGTYLVTLVAIKSTGSNPCIDTTYAYVRIYPTNTANFATADVCAGTPATFTDLSTTDYGVVNGWYWNFGNGDTTGTQNPVYTYNTPGTYNVTLINYTNLGCKDTMVRAINIIEAANVDFTFPDPVCEGPPVTFTNNSTPVSANFQWTFSNGTGTNVFSPSVPLPVGSYTISLLATVPGGCDDSLTKTLTVNPVPVPNVSNDTSICPNQSVQLFAHDGTTYAWAPPTYLNNPTLPNPVASPLAPTGITYTVTVTNQYQCTATGDVAIAFYPPAQVFTGPDTSTCLNPISYRDTVQLTANGALTYQWQPAATLNNPNIANPIARPDSNTLYIVTGTDANGCQAADSVVVFVFDPALNVIIDDAAGVCIGDTISVNVVNQGSSNYFWTPTQFIINETTYSPGFFPPDTTTYTLTVSNYCYTKSDSVRINVWPLPVLVLKDVDSVCYGQPITLQVGGASTYVWDTDSTLTNAQTDTPTVNSLVSSTYYVTGTSIYGCQNRDSIWVEVITLPYVEAGNDTIIWKETKGIIQGSTNESSFFWTPETGLETPKALTSVCDIEETQIYYLYVTSEYGCSNYDSVKVIVKTVTLLEIPTAFSPNGDGINDKFRIVRWLNIEKLKDFSVYNRWGEKVFGTTDLNEGWDGTFRYTQQPISTFVWVAVALTKDGDEIIKKGNVTLIR